MPLPTLEQYNEALQYPGLSLTDPAFKSATVATNGWGTPLALAGGFALTYTVSVGGRKFAVRCFHKQSPALETRYLAISRRLRTLRSAYFVDFEFQTQGVRVGGSSFPVVKMAWASGMTMGEFLETEHRDPTALKELQDVLMDLAAFLESQQIAHGDLQPGNVMVSSGGRTVQLIDYDGMYVGELEPLGSAEVGLRSFQHPQRSGTSWNPRLDRFAFIILNLALRALQVKPSLWSTYQADEMSLLFRANDLVQPRQSSIFQELMAMPELASAAKGFAAICESPMDKIPTVADFAALRNIPQGKAAPQLGATPARRNYLAAFPVVSASSYSTCLARVGDVVELVGQVTQVHHGTTKQTAKNGGAPYIFVNFGHWRGEIVKLQIWSEGIAALAVHPDKTWEGKWVSAQGLMEPPYFSPWFGYSHLAINITHSGQMHVITEAEARFRLAGSSSRSEGGEARVDNSKVLEAVQARRPGSSGSSSRQYRPASPTAAHIPARPISQNQAVLQSMRTTQTPGPGTYGQPTTPLQSQPPPTQTSRRGCPTLIGFMVLIATILTVAAQSSR